MCYWRWFKDKEVDDRSLAHEVTEGWLRRQGLEALQVLACETRTAEHEKARRRLYGHLMRRGFRGDALREAMDEVRTLAEGHLADR